MKQQPSKSQKVFVTTDEKLVMLKKLTRISKLGLIDSAVDLLIANFKSTGVIVFSTKGLKNSAQHK
jgi:hypothetical protein